MKIYNFFRGNKKKEKNRIKYNIDNIDTFICMFKSALIIFLYFHQRFNYF